MLKTLQDYQGLTRLYAKTANEISKHEHGNDVSLYNGLNFDVNKTLLFSSAVTTTTNSET
jgi:hypothetical protein